MNEPDAPPELRPDELLATLTHHGVQFLVVGGMGCRLHGAQHVTQDLDLCPAWGQENFDRLADALHELDARLRLPPELGDVEVRANGKLLRETSVTHWRTRAGDIDVLLSIPGEHGRPVGFRELSPRAMQITVGEAAIVVAALEDIIRSKEHADRDKDRVALPSSERSRHKEPPTRRPRPSRHIVSPASRPSARRPPHGHRTGTNPGTTLDAWPLSSPPHPPVPARRDTPASTSRSASDSPAALSDRCCRSSLPSLAPDPDRAFPSGRQHKRGRAALGRESASRSGRAAGRASIRGSRRRASIHAALFAESGAGTPACKNARLPMQSRFGRSPTKALRATFEALPPGDRNAPTRSQAVAGQ